MSTEWFAVLSLLVFVGFVAYVVFGGVIDGVAADMPGWNWVTYLRYVFAVLVPTALYVPTRLFVQSFRSRN